MGRLTNSPSAATPTPLSLKARLLLIAFGILGALAVSALAVQFISLAPKGTEFNSLADLRRAMTDSPAASSSKTQSSAETGGISLRGIIEPHPSDSIIYTLKPNLDLKFVRARVVTNSCGMRSPERPIAKPPGVYRIALLGDSFAFGWGVEQSKSFAQALEDNLNRIAAGSQRFEVLNFGVPGYSTFQEVALFEERGLDFNPDAVLVYFVQNDFGMPFFIRDLSGNKGILSSVKFVQLGKRLLTPDALDKQIADIGFHPNRALIRLSELSAQHGLKTFVAINPRSSWKRELNQLPVVKKSQGITFIPLREGLLEHIKRNQIPEEALTLSYDPHPSELRHTILGSLLTPYFVEAASL
jgi:hypothetical protein